MYTILPFVEQEAAYREQDYGVAVPVYMCPTRGRTNPQDVPDVDPVFPDWWYDNGGKTDYAGNVSIFLGNMANNPDAPRLRRNTETIAGILDGTSNTILVGEKAMSPLAYNTGGWFWDEPIFCGGGAGGTVRGGEFVLRDSERIIFDNLWGAAHPDGAQFLFGDGTVRTLSYATSHLVVKALMSPRGGEVVPTDLP
jgi:hypothetical protein